LKSKLKAKRAEGVTQVVGACYQAGGSEFTPQYCQNKQKQKHKQNKTNK
jgi:hypothetical protein